MYLLCICLYLANKVLLLLLSTVRLTASVILVGNGFRSKSYNVLRYVFVDNSKLF